MHLSAAAVQSTAEVHSCCAALSLGSGGSWILTHLERPEEQVEFSRFNIHGEAADKQCPDLETETAMVRVRVRVDRKGRVFNHEVGLTEELNIS